MKKILLIPSLFLGTILLFSSCEPNDINLEKEQISEEQMLQNITFTNEGKILKKSINNPSNTDEIEIAWRLGRKSRGCAGFGICKQVKPQGIDDSDIRDIVTPVEELTKLGYIKLEVSEFNLEADKLPIIVDNDITFELNGTQKVVKAGSYSFDSTIGEKGGYAITIQ